MVSHALKDFEVERDERNKREWSPFHPVIHPFILLYFRRSLSRVFALIFCAHVLLKHFAHFLRTFCRRGQAHRREGCGFQGPDEELQQEAGRDEPPCEQASDALRASDTREPPAAGAGEVRRGERTNESIQPNFPALALCLLACERDTLSPSNHLLVCLLERACACVLPRAS